MKLIIVFEKKTEIDNMIWNKNWNRQYDLENKIKIELTIGCENKLTLTI